MMPLFTCITTKVSYGEPSSVRQRSLIRGTLVTSYAMRKILHEAEGSACSRRRTRWMRPWPDRVSVNDRFSTNRIRDADDGAGGPGRMLGQGILQLGGVRVLLVGNDHVLDQVDHVPVSPAGPWPAAPAPAMGHIPCYAKSPLPSGKGPDLHKLVAGTGFEPLGLWVMSHTTHVSHHLQRSVPSR